MATFLKQLTSRGCVHDTSHYDELEAALEKQPLNFYCGFDPTASSLHVGSMLPLLIMRRLQQHGHRPIVLIGSATGMIGDPSGKSEERKLLDKDSLAINVAGIEKQISLFLSNTGSNGYQLVKNDDWLGKLNYIDFLRDIGKHFSVNAMIAKDSVRSRLESREQGISYTEFSYMLLQAYDFLWLYENYNCKLQVGGSDQWGNITAGTDLIRKKLSQHNPSAFGMTFPLLTTSTGAKFGKTEQGAVWLDSERTSPYKFYQYWVNSTDADVIRFLKLFTELSSDELNELEALTLSKPEQREAQKRLATALTTLVHGSEETQRAIAASSLLFADSFDNTDSATLMEVFSDVPSTELSRNSLSELSLTDLLVATSLADSKASARRLIEGGGIYFNNKKTADPRLTITQSMFIDASIAVLRSGKKKYHLVKLT